MLLSSLLGFAGVRRVAGTAAVLCLSILALAGFLYWQTVGFLTRQIDDNLLADGRSFAQEAPDALRARMARALSSDQRESKAYGLFAPDGTPLAGNIPKRPDGLPEPERPVATQVRAVLNGRERPLDVRLVTERCGDGSILVMGRNTATLEEVTEIITRAMALAIVPAVALSLLAAVVVSRATSRRIAAVHRACRSIMAGRFDQRLPIRTRTDEFDQLSSIVNTMLDEIERLVIEVKGAGDAIAHDLRTPLTRLRARLERHLKAASDNPPLQLALQKSLADIDQLLITIAALLRIAEVEQSRRQQNFATVDLAELVAALAEFYEPIAEEKGLRFRVEAARVDPVGGDADLLFEAVANLVDNAIKFTPEGGTVGITVGPAADGPALTVWDTGPGVPATERDQVVKRFYRLDRSRHQQGSGLGLSLVLAIARLHGLTLRLSDRTGGGLRASLQF